MKKIIFIITLITFQLLGNYQDFYFFNEAQVLMEQNENQEAKVYFNKLIEEYPNSRLISSNYAKHFIGLNYFYLGEYEKAISFLEKAKYIPTELQEAAFFRSKRNDYFQYTNEFYIAKAYEELGNKERAIHYYLKLFKEYFDLELEVYRKKALKKLINYNEKYEFFYEASYEHNFENITKLNNDEILLIANYLFNKGYLEESQFLYKGYLLREDNYEVKERLLEALTRQRKYNEIINITMKLTYNNQDPLYVFYLANSHRRLGNFEKAIYYFKKIDESSKFYSGSQHILGRLYIAINNIEKALYHLENSSARAALLLKANIFFREGDREYKRLHQFLEDNPFLDISAEFRYKLYSLSEKKEYLEDIIKYNPNTYYYELALEILNYQEKIEIFPIESYNKKYKELNKLLKYLESFPDKNLGKIVIDLYEFPSEDRIYGTILRIKNYINSKDFYNAINLAIRNHRTFYKYANLRKFLYPKYYKENVEYWSKEYNVDPHLIYSIIRQESHFSKGAVSRAAAYGLMQLILPTAQEIKAGISTEELLDVHTNIKLGTAYIKKLLNAYNNRIGTALAAYNGGPHNLTRWKLDEEGDIIIDSITFVETKGYVEKVLNNYKKYNRIYGAN